VTSAAVIVVGRELLDGSVRDFNGHFLCRELTAAGLSVASLVMVDDDLERVAAAVRASVDGGAALIVTTGGLGPTDDDLTLAAIARAFELPLIAEPVAYGLVASAYAELASRGAVPSGAMTPARAKMANLPEGASAIANPSGTAPAMYLQIQGRVVIALPGVPREVEAIYRSALSGAVRALAAGRCFVEHQVIVSCGDESVLAPVLADVTAAFADIYLKSRADAFGVTVQVPITLSLAMDTQCDAEQRVLACVAYLDARLKTIGVEVLVSRRER